MAIHIPITHIYKEVNRGKFKETKHYQIEEVLHGTNQLSKLINISKDRNCAKSSPKYWIRLREDNKWNKKYLTGLFKTSARFIYKGDENNRQHLILFKFSDNAEGLIIFYFKNYFTGNLREVLHFIPVYQQQ